MSLSGSLVGTVPSPIPSCTYSLISDSPVWLMALHYYDHGTHQPADLRRWRRDDLAQAVAKTDTCTQLHSLVFLSPFHSHSCTIMRIHIRIQRPPSCKQICATPSLSLSTNTITQHKTWTRGMQILHIHTQHNLHPQKCTHTYSLYPPPSNADERDLQGSGTKERVTLSSNHHMVKKPCVSLATQHSQATLIHTYDLNSSINRTLERAAHS